MSQKGFTFIEVLIAMTIFTLAALAAVSVGDTSVRATREAKEMSIATWLLQSLMTELETKLEGEGIDRACEKKKEGKFDPPYDKYTWATFCYEIDFKISESASALMQAQMKGQEAEENNKENQLLKMILDTASKYISKSSREIHAEVYWMRGKIKRKVEVTTHFARYDQPVALPGFGGLGGAQAPQ